MKKLVLIVALFVGVITVAEAQRNTSERPSQSQSGQQQQRGQRMSPEERLEKQVTEMKTKLALTDDQTTKVKAIMKANQDKQRAAFEKARENGAQPDREKMRTEMQANMKKQDADIKAVLTAEQKTKYDAMVKAREERIKNRQGGPGGPGGQN